MPLAPLQASSVYDFTVFDAATKPVCLEHFQGRILLLVPLALRDPSTPRNITQLQVRIGGSAWIAGVVRLLLLSTGRWCCYSLPWFPCVVSVEAYPPSLPLEHLHPAPARGLRL